VADVKTKKPPVFISPDKGVVGDRTLVLCAGPDTYQIELEALFRAMPLSSLCTAYRSWRWAQEPEVLARIAASRLRDEGRSDGT
jgi:hypothetical protein